MRVPIGVCLYVDTRMYLCMCKGVFGRLCATPKPAGIVPATMRSEIESGWLGCTAGERNEGALW